MSHGVRPKIISPLLSVCILRLSEPKKHTYPSPIRIIKDYSPNLLVFVEVPKGEVEDTSEGDPGEVGEKEQVGPGSVFNRVKDDDCYTDHNPQEHYLHKRLKNSISNTLVTP